MIRNLLLDNDLSSVRKRKVGIHIFSRILVRLQFDLDHIRDSIGCSLQMTGTGAGSFHCIWWLVIETGKSSNLRKLCREGNRLTKSVYLPGMPRWQTWCWWPLMSPHAWPHCQCPWRCPPPAWCWSWSPWCRPGSPPRQLAGWGCVSSAGEDTAMKMLDLLKLE